MIDKISDETLQLIASDYLDVCSLIDISALLAKELIARRAAEVKPVKLPSRFRPVVSSIIKEKPSLSAAMQLSNEHGGWLNRSAVITAIKAAGGTIEGE